MMRDTKRKMLLQTYNRELRSWGNTNKGNLESSISSNMTNAPKLINSLRANFYTEKVIEGNQIYRLGFSFRREGVFVHYGVGKGYERKGGQTVRTAKSQTTKERRPKNWFNSVIQENINNLNSIVSNYHEDLIINSSKVFIGGNENGR